MIDFIYLFGEGTNFTMRSLQPCHRIAWRNLLEYRMKDGIWQFQQPGEVVRLADNPMKRLLGLGMLVLTLPT
jgi:hypothetical protein